MLACGNIGSVGDGHAVKNTVLVVFIKRQMIDRVVYREDELVLRDKITKGRLHPAFDGSGTSEGDISALKFIAVFI